MDNVINVKSEIGTLKKVLLHRPGNELLNLTPDTLSRLLFDDIPFLPEAQKEHDEFAHILKENGIEVVYLEDLMAEVLELGDDIENKFIMRKVMFKWLVMFLAVVLCAGVVSCKDDDDDDNGASGNSIVGTWRYDFGYNAYALMTFNEDLTGIYREYDEEDGGWWSYTFTWLQNNGKVMVIDDEDGYGDEYYNVTVTATKLTWTYNNGYGSEKQVWTRQQ